MKRKSFETMNCSIAQTLEVVGDPWTLLIVRDAMWGVSRFDDFQRSLGIPRNTLTSRLNALVEHGVLERSEYQEHPPRYEYRLTRKGKQLNDVLVTMLAWGDRWGDLPQAPVTLLDEETGEEIEPVLVDRGSGKPLREIRIRRRLNRRA